MNGFDDNASYLMCKVVTEDNDLEGLVALVTCTADKSIGTNVNSHL